MVVEKEQKQRGPFFAALVGYSLALPPPAASSRLLPLGVEEGGSGAALLLLLLLQGGSAGEGALAPPGQEKDVLS